MSLRNSVLISFVDKYLQISITVLTTVILSRLLTPADIGLFSVGMSIITISHVFRDFGISNYIVQEPNLTPDRLRTAFGLSLAFGWPVALVLFVSSHWVAQFYGDPLLQSVIMVLSFNFVVLPISVPAMSLVRREMGFNLLFRVNVISTSVMAAVQIGLAFLGFGAMSLAWASLANVSVMTALAIIYRPHTILVWPRFREWRSVISFGGLASVTTLFSLVGSSAADPIVGRLLGFDAVGMYSRAQGLIYLFYRDVMGAIHQVAFPAFAAEYRDGRSLHYSYLKALEHVTGIAWPFYAVAAIAAEPLITTMFGGQWAPSAPLVQLLAIAFSISTLWSLSGHVLYAMGYPQRMCVTEGVIQSSRIIGLLIAGHISLAAVAWVQTPIALVGFIVHFYFLRQLIGLSLAELANACVRSCLVTISASAIPFITMSYYYTPGGPPYLALAASAAGAALGWLVGVFATSHPARDEVINVLGKARAFAARSAG